MHQYTCALIPQYTCVCILCMRQYSKAVLHTILLPLRNLRQNLKIPYNSFKCMSPAISCFYCALCGDYMCLFIFSVCFMFAMLNGFAVFSSFMCGFEKFMLLPVYARFRVVHALNDQVTQWFFRNIPEYRQKPSSFLSKDYNNPKKAGWSGLPPKHLILSIFIYIYYNIGIF